MFGYYGKIPSQGDFLKRRADVGFVQLWDSWLQASFAASRSALGDGWQAEYENAPLWRFCFGRDVCGPDPMIGVMMPSQDRVGRCFPLTLFCRLKRSVAVSALEHDAFMTTLEDTALRTLQDGRTKADLDAELDRIPAPDLPEANAEGQSYWLSVFFGGKDRMDHRSFAGLPRPEQFCELLNPNVKVSHV